MKILKIQYFELIKISFWSMNVNFCHLINENDGSQGRPLCHRIFYKFAKSLVYGSILKPPFQIFGPSPLQVPALLPTQPVAEPVQGLRGQTCRNLQGRRTQFSLGGLKCTYFYLAFLKFTAIYVKLHIGMVFPNKYSTS